MEIIYHTDGKGRWWKKYTKEKCSNSIFVKYSCQREEGHEGNHWAYMESGAYVHTTPDGGCCILFPENDGYISPKENRNEYYSSKQSNWIEILDSKEIEELEENQDNIQVIRPLKEKNV